MKEEIIFAGFGGQGVLLAGQVLAQAAMLEGREISWMPSYGPEMRGGTANCIVIISDSPISSPVVRAFDSGVIFNQPSADKFAPAIKRGGVMIYESGSVVQPPTRADIELFEVSAAKEADALKNLKILNMVMLGAFLAVRPLVKLPSVLDALKEILPERYHHTLPLNEQALRRGMQLTNTSPDLEGVFL
jgi:2-oxoglutarate ferredoxin oxidoreductase subunit gamma